jgi:hypothetical protein
MGTSAVFPHAAARTGMYESFYLRAVAPDQPLGVWIRHTAHKRAGERARGSVWCTLFDARRGRPFMHKLTSDGLEVPPKGWITIKDGGATGSANEAEGGYMASDRAYGRCGRASWSLRWSSPEQELRHLPRELLYRAPLPRTKLTSPAPRASFAGWFQLAGEEEIEVHHWHGMIGHNWGSEHAERWMWLHAVDFSEAPEAWLDVALGRIKLAGALTPWVANGALSVGGRRYRLGGPGARGLRVRETPAECEVRVPGEHDLELRARVTVPQDTAAGWRYADPDGSGHDVVNCSIAGVDLEARLPGERVPLTLHSEHGGAYELGMREHDHGVPLAPFSDG